MRLSLTSSAKLITVISGHVITPGTLYNKIRQKTWPYKHYRNESSIIIPPPYFLDSDDVKRFAENFKGLKRGRPFGSKSKSLPF